MCIYRLVASAYSDPAIMIQPAKSAAVKNPFGESVPLHRLQVRDLFEFVETEIRVSTESTIRVRPGRLEVIIRPWGARNQATGPVGPWMFACRDQHGGEHHYALPPNLEVRRFESRC